MNLALILAAMLQTVPVPTAKLTWDAVVPDTFADLTNVVKVNRYNVYRAPFVTDVDGNKSCGAFTKLGNTGGLWMLIKSEGCYSVSVVQTETGLDPDTNLPVIFTSESARSEPVVVVFGEA